MHTPPRQGWEMLDLGYNNVGFFFFFVRRATSVLPPLILDELSLVANVSLEFLKP